MMGCMAAPNQKIGMVTGDRKGLGRALSEHFLRSGCVVIGCSRGPSTLSHSNYHHFEVDVANEAQVLSMFQEIRSRWGRLDFCVNNAGVASMNHSLLMPFRTACRIVEVNLLGTFLISREASRLMVSGGKIVNISSVAVALDLEGEAIYAASKAGVETLTRVLSKELRSSGVHVNALALGPIRTDLIRGVSSRKIEKILLDSGRAEFTRVEDVCLAIDQLLVSEESGKIIPV